MYGELPCFQSVEKTVAVDDEGNIIWAPSHLHLEISAALTAFNVARAQKLGVMGSVISSNDVVCNGGAPAARNHDVFRRMK